jgi:hypothetical protein
MEVRRSQLRLIAIPDESRMGVSRGRKAPLSSVVGRFLDAFDKDASGSVRRTTLCKARNSASLRCNGAKREVEQVISC